MFARNAGKSKVMVGSLYYAYKLKKSMAIITIHPQQTLQKIKDDIEWYAKREPDFKNIPLDLIKITNKGLFADFREK